MECVAVLHGKGGIEETGHSNRVFSVKFYKDDENFLVSGGYDHRIILWDLRVNLPIHSLNNNVIYGDAIDVYSNTMLSCSSIDEGILRLFDIKSFKKMTNMMGKHVLSWEKFNDDEDEYLDDGEEEEEA